MASMLECFIPWPKWIRDKNKTNGYVQNIETPTKRRALMAAEKA